MSDTMREILERAEVATALALIEADESACKRKYVDAKTGRFKGGKGERFDNCVKYMGCKGGVDDPEALCAKIARAKGLAGGQSEDLDEEAVVGPVLVDRMAQAMLNSPKLDPLTSRIFDTDQLEMFQGLILEPLRSLIAKALDVANVRVSGGLLAKSGREMKSVARGDLGAE